MTFNRANVQKWMIMELQYNSKNYTEPGCNEFNMTKLAEFCADHFDMNDENGPLDDESHWIWEVAQDVCAFFPY